jgi:hypothetical protein
MHAFPRIAIFPVLAALAAVAPACSSSSSGSGGSSGGGSGGGPGGTLDCAWLSSDNCWKTTAAAAQSCLPASTEMGTLSADNKTCTYASGATVTFDTALTLPLPADPSQVTWNFTVTKNGQSCFVFHQQNNQNNISMTTSAGTASVAVGADYTVSCPGGASYSASSSNVLSLLSCDAGVLGGFPGTTYESTATSVWLSMLGAGGMQSLGPGGGIPLFNCKK